MFEFFLLCICSSGVERRSCKHKFVIKTEGFLRKTFGLCQENRRSRVQIAPGAFFLCRDSHTLRVRRSYFVSTPAEFLVKFLEEICAGCICSFQIVPGALIFCGDG